VAGNEPGLFVLVALLGLQTAIVGGVLAQAVRNGTEPAPPGSQLSRSVLVVAAAAVVPWLAYALHMWALNRESRPDGDVTLGIDHYSVQGALAFSLAVLPVSAALRADLRPLLAACAGIAASYLGCVSLAWPDAVGGLGRTWSLAAIGWGLALIGATFSRRVRVSALRNRPAG
jgi:hypothetical protein